MPESSIEVSRLPIVGVMGSGTRADPERAAPLGDWLARRGVHLLTGGGGGAMAAVCESFCRVLGRAGSAIGIIPYDEAMSAPPPHYPNPWVEIPIYTHLPLRGSEGAHTLSRNHINVLTAHVIVALSGGAGTASEVALARRYSRPVVAFAGSREEIPTLGNEVLMLADLEEIQSFIDAALENHACRSRPESVRPRDGGLPNRLR